MSASGGLRATPPISNPTPLVLSLSKHCLCLRASVREARSEEQCFDKLSTSGFVLTSMSRTFASSRLAQTLPSPRRRTRDTPARKHERATAGAWVPEPDRLGCATIVCERPAGNRTTTRQFRLRHRVATALRQAQGARTLPSAMGAYPRLQSRALLAPAPDVRRPRLSPGMRRSPLASPGRHAGVEAKRYRPHTRSTGPLRCRWWESITYMVRFVKSNPLERTLGDSSPVSFWAGRLPQFRWIKRISAMKRKPGSRYRS